LPLFLKLSSDSVEVAHSLDVRNGFLQLLQLAIGLLQFPDGTDGAVLHTRQCIARDVVGFWLALRVGGRPLRNVVGVTRRWFGLLARMRIAGSCLPMDGRGLAVILVGGG